MKRLGTTTGGGAIIEIDAAEAAVIQQAMTLLNSITADEPATAPAPTAEPRKYTPRELKKVIGKPVQGGSKVCAACKEAKPAGDYYDRDNKCKLCRLAHQKAAHAARAKGQAIVTKVTGGKSRIDMIREADRRIRERDPELDRPTAGGRTLPVGGGE